MFIKSSQAKLKKAGPMKIREYKINKNFSADLVQFSGLHGKIKCLKEDRIYFILSGDGEFILGKTKKSVSKHDLVFVPKNTPYDIQGKLTYLLVCSPAFNENDDIILS